MKPNDCQSCVPGVQGTIHSRTEGSGIGEHLEIAVKIGI
jgi:hypothetical protein